ncbi:Cof-type HAD-IIB family hydrolase [Priestia megaterium]|uniref:Cof-type HAD-IIB family hydrolase n=1 Tax=Priestia megaterium TaxID=1404 RepID=A0A6M6DYC0_PRIMG|nr:Cof-type HAD-IIB family hydrolase [Priestia megaterium]QJX79953.1 Cof-type HAD-IIB family hydrolase [Priestia megaterium]
MKLICLDMDGTTLSSTNEISKENIEAIRKAQEEGHIVMVLSGRAPESINATLEKYDLNCPIGGSNGTAVFADGNLLELTSLTKEQNKAAVSELDKEFVPYKIYTNKGIYVPQDWENRLNKVLSSGKIPSEYYKNENFERMTKIPDEAEGIQFFDSVQTLIEDNDITIQKFFILSLDPNQKDRLQVYLQEIEDTYITTSSPFNLEVMNIKGNKGNGLKVMAEYFGIPLEDTVAIGDQFNDIPMFKVAGLAIAMGNAEQEVKELSDVVTLTNDEHGVAFAIDKYVLKK